MSHSLEFFQRCAAESGFAIEPLEKIVRLGEMAADIMRHPFLSQVLALKGGTAINMCFGVPKRLSVDLDFNYIGELDRNKMIEDRPRVESAVSDLGRRKGYSIQNSPDAFAGRKTFLNYKSATGRPDRIEIDLNFLFRLPLDGTAVRSLWQPGDLDFPEVRVVGLQELVLGKVMALLDRTAVRDLWDIANLHPEANAVLTMRTFRAKESIHN